MSLKLLRTQFPNVRRCELNDLLTRYRRVLCRLHRKPQCRLDWRRPGTVWAMDFVDAPELVDGRFSQLLAILDVASRQTLAWLPMESATAEIVERILTELFPQQGPSLYSPPHCPRYRRHGVRRLSEAVVGAGKQLACSNNPSVFHQALSPLRSARRAGRPRRDLGEGYAATTSMQWGRRPAPALSSSCGFKASLHCDVFGSAAEYVSHTLVAVNLPHHPGKRLREVKEKVEKLKDAPVGRIPKDAPSLS